MNSDNLVTIHAREAAPANVWMLVDFENHRCGNQIFAPAILTSLMFAVAMFGIASRAQAEVIVEPPGGLVAGRTIGEWSTNWWRWAAAMGWWGNPFSDTTGQFAHVNQSGPVFFLAGSPGGVNSRNFTVDPDTYLLMPLLAGALSQLELGFDLTEDEVRQAAREQANQIDSLHATLDGNALPEAILFQHRVVSPGFSFLAFNGNPVNFPEGESGIAVADGYFLMLAPLSPGTHVLNYGGGATSLGIFIDQTDTITVLPPVAPSIIMEPESQAAHVGQDVRFTVTATGYPLKYQWRKDGVDLPGEMSDTFHLGPALNHHAGAYTVVVSNSLRSVTSAPPAVLTVDAFVPGTVVAWGAGTSDLGSYPEFGQSLVPDAARGDVKTVAAGAFHTVALKADGSILAWGDNEYGQAIVPTGADGSTAIAAGMSHTLVLRSDQSVLAWGAGIADTGSEPHFGQSLLPLSAQSGVRAIAAGGFHSLALKDDGSVVAWGDNRQGQTTVPSAAQSRVVAIAAGHAHSLALKIDGSVVMWGGDFQNLGTVPFEARRGVTAIAAGINHSVALKVDGSVVAWGDNLQGQTTVPLGARSGVIAIAAGGWHSLALKVDGSVVMWGSLTYGRRTVPTGLGGVIAVASGLEHSVVLLGSGIVLPVTLSARVSHSDMILTWPTNAVGFNLQSTTDLVPPVTWVDSSITPAVINQQFTVTNGMSPPTRFYRLEKP